VKFWDLDTQHCFKTLVGHSREVRFAVCPSVYDSGTLSCVIVEAVDILLLLF